MMDQWQINYGQTQILDQDGEDLLAEQGTHLAKILLNNF